MHAPQSDAADADAARAAQLRHDALVQKQRFDSVLRFTQTGTAVSDTHLRAHET